MEHYSILVYGAGRMGLALLNYFLKSEKVYLYNRDPVKGKKAAEERGVPFLPLPQVLKEVDVILLALPGEVVPQVIKEISSFINPNTVILDIATASKKEKVRPFLRDDISLVGVKFVSSYHELASNPVIIMDADDEKGRKVATYLFSQLGQLMEGEGGLVETINSIASRRAIEACLTIKRDLEEGGINHEKIVKSALSSVAAGTIKAFANKELGTFGLRCLERLKEDAY